jgi:hypothetical protein
MVSETWGPVSHTRDRLPETATYVEDLSLVEKSAGHVKVPQCMELMRSVNRA